jgi:DNA (cytosine-5)-methyltransferase 1
LEGQGYAVWPLVVGAWAVGAPHRRGRVWIVAHRNGRAVREQQGRGGGTSGTDPASEGRIGEDVADEYGAGRSSQRGRWLLDGERQASGDDADRCGERPMGDAAGRRLARPRTGNARSQPPTKALCWPSRPGEPQHEWEEPRLAQFSMGGATHGLPERLARRWNRESLKALGNSVVPQVVAVIGQAIAEVDANDERRAEASIRP